MEHKIPEPFPIKIELSLFQAHLLFQLIRPFIRSKCWISTHRYFYSQLSSIVDELACAEFEYDQFISNAHEKE